jgi:signal transduction histidine kinase
MTVTLVTFVFSALTFWVLAVTYWRERRLRDRAAFAAFTIACAAAFSLNLLLVVRPTLETPLTVAEDLVTGLIPAVLLHLVLGRRPVWFYAVAGCASVAVSLDDLELVSIPYRDQLPAITLATAAAVGLAFLRVKTRLQQWHRWLLLLTLLAASAFLAVPSIVTVAATDYLFLAFFCVTLYYQERLVFFDLLIKRGAFFSLAVTAIGLLLSAARVVNTVALALMLTALFLVAPWADGRLGALIDRVFLRRRYSPSEAERVFVSELQLASSEAGLRSRAERSLENIFQAPAMVSFEAEPTTPGGGGMIAGCVVVKPRPSGIPFMSDDRRLFDSLARTLTVVLENVRFRERQQELQLLASRAELKALRAQINPHFLFNALNAIAGLIPTNPELADRTVEELAQVFRYTLRKSETEWVRLDEEVEFVGAYLCVEQARFGDRLRVIFNLDPQAGAVLVPAMCVQPLVENAVKHAASLAETGGVVRLSCRLEDEILRLEVSDNGPGFPAGFSLANSEGHGLRNVAERLRGYYGEAGQFGWESSPGATRVWLIMPSRPAVESNRRQIPNARAHRG